MKNALDTEKTTPPDFLNAALLGQYAQESKQVVVEQERVLSRPFSTVRFLRITSGNTSSRIVSKTIAPHDVNRAILESENQAAVEFKALQQLHPKFSVIPNCNVPKPLLLLADHDTYLMDFVPGNDLDSWLKRARGYCSSGKWEKARGHFLDTGRWLKCFQEFTGVTFEGEKALNSLTNRMTERLKELHLKCTDATFSSRLEEQMDGLFKGQTEQLRKSGERLPVCGRHGDFGGWNIIANDEGVTVIDFMGYGRDPAIMDYVKMLVCFHDNEENIIYRRKLVKELRDAFITGYGATHATPGPVWTLCEAYYRLCSIIACQQTGHLRWDHQQMKKKILKKHLDWFADFAQGQQGIRGHFNANSAAGIS